MSMKQVVLHGNLGSLFGENWNLDIQSPAEAVYAIDVNRPGFTRHLIESEKEGFAYQVLLGDSPLEADALRHPFGSETLHIVPMLAGAGRNGDANAKIIVGAVIAIASVGIGMAAYGASEAGFMEMAQFGEMSFEGAMSQTALFNMSYGTIALMGAGLAFTGISQLLAATPKAASNKDGSYTFSGPKNTTAQGVPIPIGYGELIVGSVVVSSGIQVLEEQIS